MAPRGASPAGRLSRGALLGARPAVSRPACPLRIRTPTTNPQPHATVSLLTKLYSHAELKHIGGRGGSYHPLPLFFLMFWILTNCLFSIHAGRKERLWEVSFWFFSLPLPISIRLWNDNLFCLLRSQKHRRLFFEPSHLHRTIKGSGLRLGGNVLPRPMLIGPALPLRRRAH